MSKICTTSLLGGLVALLGWRLGMNPPSVGLDSSWNGGLAMATAKGLRFGVDVVFSYGPLGFLQAQGIWYSNLAVVAFLFSATLYLVFCIALVAAFRRTLPLIATVLVAFLIVTLPLVELPLAAAVLTCLAALQGERSEPAIYALMLGGASFGAVEALVKLSTGPLVAILFLIALIGLRARWWQIAGFLALFTGELLMVWGIIGQRLADLPDFARNSWEIISAYSAAMSRQVDVPAWQVDAATLVAAIVAVAIVVACGRARFRDVRARRAGVVLMGVATFAIFKEGIVRPDAGHLSLFFSTACVLWVAIPWVQARRRWMLVGVAAIALLGIPVRPPGPDNLDAIANVRFAADQVRTLFSGSRRAELSEAGRASMKATYRLDPRTRAALRGHSVAIDPWEIGVAWAYRLDWEPLPVFQNYSAYSSVLDGLNVATVRSPVGPERILRENPALVYPEFPTRTIDNRLPAWDPPAEALAILCHFIPLRTTARWQVLGRTANRCGQPRHVLSIEAPPSTAVSVPRSAPGEIIFARIDGVEVEGLQRLQTLLLHAPTRHVVVDGTRSYRLIPGTATDGLMLRGSDRIGAEGPFSQIPHARTIAVAGTDGTVRISFFRMAVRVVRDADG